MRNAWNIRWVHAWEGDPCPVEELMPSRCVSSRAGNAPCGRVMAKSSMHATFGIKTPWHSQLKRLGAGSFS